MIDDPKNDPDDLAPDADDVGDGLPEEFRGLVHDGDIVPDEVDDLDYEGQRGDNA
jgi:hypothetical protein